MDLNKHATCCIGCTFMSFNVPSQVLKQLLCEDLGVDEIVDPSNSTVLRATESLTDQERDLFEQARDSARMGRNRVPILHKHFFQKNILTFSILNTEQFQISRGEILELFVDGNQAIITKSILEDLKTEFLQINQNANLYAESDVLPVDGVVHINMKHLTLDVEYASKDSTQYVLDEFRDEQFVFDDVFDIIQSVLIPIQRVSMLIVEGCGDDSSKWLDLFTGIYGGLEDMFIVLVVAYEDYDESLQDKSSVISVTNVCVTDELKQQIVCIDLGFFNGEGPSLDQQGNLILNRLVESN